MSVAGRKKVKCEVWKKIVEDKRQEKINRFVTEIYLRLRERAEQNKEQAELDLKILEKWRKDFKELVK